MKPTSCYTKPLLYKYEMAKIQVNSLKTLLFPNLLQSKLQLEACGISMCFLCISDISSHFSYTSERIIVKSLLILENIIIQVVDNPRNVCFVYLVLFLDLNIFSNMELANRCQVNNKGGVNASH